ncbi:MAG: FMN-binding protein [Gammaproteobacteria bacterium]|nr:MAG: FMN-binding protein [Gammaproteobacteria bacterium]
MSDEAQNSALAQPSSVSLVGTLSTVAMISGFLVVLVYQITLPAITANKKEALERAIFSLLRSGDRRENYRVGKDGLTRVEGDDGSAGRHVYAGYNDDNQFVGLAIEAAAPGYQDVVRVLYGYAPECQCITGIYVLESKETPGLGDKVETDESFLENFRALDGQLNADMTVLANDIRTVKHGSKKNPWEIDAISGATVTSKAIGRMLNDSAKLMFPVVQLHRAQLEERR